MCRNLGFSLSLYSGQMCTTPQNMLVPGGRHRHRRRAQERRRGGAGIAAAVGGLIGDPARAVELPGAIVNDGVLERLERVRGVGEVVLDSRDGDASDLPGRGRPHAD